MESHQMDGDRNVGGKRVLIILAIILAGLTGYCLWLSPPIARAEEGSREPLTILTSGSLDPPDAEDRQEPLSGLSLHGTKVLELQYTGISGATAYPGLSTPPPGLVLNQRLEAEVEGLWPGIWVRGRFDDDPFFPQYLLRVDMPRASVALGDVDTGPLSPPLSPCTQALTGAQATIDWGDFTFSLAAGHPQTLTHIETFTLSPTARLYQTRLAPILAGTEIIRIGNTILSPSQDYQIDYTLGRIQLLGFWPDAQEVAISYQVPDTTFAKKPLVQGLRGQYQAEHGILGLSYLSRRDVDTQNLHAYPFSSADDISYTSRLAWSALSWEQGTEGTSPHWAAEVWRRTSLPAKPRDRTVEDMEDHTLRHPLSLEIADTDRWSRPEVTSGSCLHLSKATGWSPAEGVTRSALQLDFVMEGSGARVKTRLTLPAFLNLAASSTLVLTLGLPQPLPGVKMELALISGSGGSFHQSVTLGGLVGWQDIVLARDDWVKAGIPSWEKITAIELELTSLLPGTSKGQVIFGALDVVGTNQATDRWQHLKPRDTLVQLESIPLPIAPWMPPPGNTALSVSIEKLKEPSPAEPPQVWGLLPRSFSPSEAQYLTFWAHAPAPGTGLTIWLLDEHNQATSPFQFGLSPGWHQYSITLTKPAAQLGGRTIASIVLAITTAPGTKSATILFDEWQLQGVEAMEGYMARFAASVEKGPIHWELSGSGQTSAFQWDAPGMVENVPHPNHLKLAATFNRPGNKHTSFSVLQAGIGGIGDGQTTLQLKANAWDRTILEAQLTLPNGSDDLYHRSTETTPTGRFRVRTTLNTSIWEFLAFRQPQTLTLTDPWEARPYQGMAVSLKQHLTPGVLHLGSWHLAHGETGQTLSTDLDWSLFTALPINTTFHIWRYQASPSTPPEIGGLGRLESTWHDPDHRWSVAAGLDQRVGREMRSFIAQGLDLQSTGRKDSFDLENPSLWKSLGESPRHWRQEATLAWRWHPSETVNLQGHWQREATRELEKDRSSVENGGSLSLSWPWSPNWRSKGIFSWSQRQDPAYSTLLSTEYSLVSEGTWGEAWSGMLLASQKQIRWQEPNPPNSPHRGNRWTLRGSTDYSYIPQGSIGLGLNVSHQTATTPDLTSHRTVLRSSGRPGPLLLGDQLGQDGFSETGMGSLLMPRLPGSSGEAGTYLDTQIYWTLAQDAFYRMSLGSLTYLPLKGGASSMDYYGLASVEKELGALGSGRLELSAQVGSRTAWAIGLGWVKQLLKDHQGLYLNTSLRHVQQSDYQFTDSRLGLEYRF